MYSQTVAIIRERPITRGHGHDHQWLPRLWCFLPILYISPRLSDSNYLFGCWNCVSLVKFSISFNFSFSNCDPRMVTMAEDRETVFQKGLSEWWNEETEHMFQRIEKWTTFARGYNRLQSHKWSKNRQTTQDSPNEPTGETSYMQRFYNLKRSRRTSQPEEAKINCCGTFSYQSNKQLDSNCLETYQHDHSIYFKTIGDIRSDKKDISNESKDNISISSEELIEWDSSSFIDLIADKSISKESNNNNNYPNKLSISDDVTDQRDTKGAKTLSPIVDLSKLDLNPTDNQNVRSSRSIDKNNFERNERSQKNNNVDNSEIDKMNKEDGLRCQEKIKRLHSFRKTKRSSRNMQRPIVGENNVAWPKVLLNYTNSFDIVNNPLNDP